MPPVTHIGVWPFTNRPQRRPVCASIASNPRRREAVAVNFQHEYFAMCIVLNSTFTSGGSFITNISTEIAYLWTVADWFWRIDDLRGAVMGVVVVTKLPRTLRKARHRLLGTASFAIREVAGSFRHATRERIRPFPCIASHFSSRRLPAVHWPRWPLNRCAQFHEKGHRRCGIRLQR